MIERYLQSLLILNFLSLSIDRLVLFSFDRRHERLEG